LFTLWLAVLLRRLRGTFWNALDANTAFEFLIPASRARISNSRAATKADTSSSPVFESAASELWTARVRASSVLARLRAFEAASSSDLRLVEENGWGTIDSEVCRERGEL